MLSKETVNILVIGTNDNWGGAASIGWQIKERLQGKGFNFNYFVSRKTSGDESVKEMKTSFCTKVASYCLAREDIYDTDWLLDTPEYKNADIIHCHNLHGRFFNLGTLKKMSLSKPIIWTLHDEWAITPRCVCTFESTELKDGFYICRRKDIPVKMLFDNDGILMQHKEKNIGKEIILVSPSQWLKRRLENSYLASHKIEHICNGIDTEIYCPGDKAAIRKKLDLPIDKKIMLFIADGGKMIPWKGWEYIERAIKEFAQKDVLFVCIGGHRDIDISEKNVLFVPKVVDRCKIADYYAAADLLLYPSLSDNFPLVILEAMACGLPIVSFDTGGIREALIHRENGYLAKYGNCDDFFSGINYILELDFSQYCNIGINSRERVIANFTLEKMTQKYSNLYHSMISNYLL